MSYVINQNYVNEIVVEKSRFIALLIPLGSEEAFAEHLTFAKNEYKDARHYTYAFRYGNLERASDDGEPQNTAGIPLLNLLKNHDLIDTALIVVRYFGGKKLGAGRLLRTYVDAGNKVILKAQKFLKVPAYKYVIATPLSEYERVSHYLEKEGHVIDESDFSGLEVKLTVRVRHEAAHNFESNYKILSKSESILLKESSNE